MDAAFWHSKWEQRHIAFHEGEVNSMLERHLGRLGLSEGARLFLPLCGKTRDIAWLLDQGHPVVGVELSEMAVKELFEELDVVPQVSEHAGMRVYQADGLDIFGGDLFDLTAEMLGTVDAIYDRAALVALPPPMRARYVPQVVSISGGVPVLLITFEYDQQLLDGPPFSVEEAEVRALYGDSHEVTSLQIEDIEGGFKGKVAAINRAWLMTPA